MHPQVLFEARCLCDHFNNALLNINDSKAIGLGALRHDDHGDISFFAEAVAGILPQLLDAEIHLGSAATVDSFGELDADGVPDALEEAQDAETCAAVSLGFHDYYFCENRAVIEHEPEPVNEASLVRDENVTIEFLDHQLLLLPLREVERGIFAVVLLLDIIERRHVQEQLGNHFVDKALHEPD